MQRGACRRAATFGRRPMEWTQDPRRFVVRDRAGARACSRSRSAFRERGSCSRSPRSWSSATACSCAASRRRSRSDGARSAIGVGARGDRRRRRGGGGRLGAKWGGATRRGHGRCVPGRDRRRDRRVAAHSDPCWSGPCSAPSSGRSSARSGASGRPSGGEAPTRACVRPALRCSDGSPGRSASSRSASPSGRCSGLAPRSRARLQRRRAAAPRSARPFLIYRSFSPLIGCSLPRARREGRWSRGNGPFRGRAAQACSSSSSPGSSASSSSSTATAAGSASSRPRRVCSPPNAPLELEVSLPRGTVAGSAVVRSTASPSAGVTRAGRVARRPAQPASPTASTRSASRWT